MEKESRPRPYRSRVREESARRTRAAIVSAATRLFIRDGYAGTSWDAVAKAAEVSRPTVVTAFGTKAALLSKVLNESLAADDEPVPVRDRSWFRPVWEATSAGGTLDAYARVCVLIASRAAGVVEALHRAADSSSEVDALWEGWLTGRRAGAAMVVGHPPLTRALAPGVGPDQAVDVLWTLNNPDLHLSLVTRAGWTEEAFEAWLARIMRAALLG
jgi:AcrR family transcriptional regulator